MKIGIFTDTYPPYINGVSTSISMLEKALRKKGHQVFIVTVNTENFSYKEEGNVIYIPGIPIGIYDYRLTGIYPLKVINKIKKWNLDVIHSHTEFSIGTFARIIAKQLDIPLVHTYHTMYEDYVHYITKGYFNNSSKKVAIHLTKFYCDKTATELIVPTKKTYDIFKNKYKIDKNIHIVPTGIDIEKFYNENFKKETVTNLRKDLKLKEDDFVVLFVGRLGKEKDVKLLIDAQKNITKKYKKIKLVIVGDGPDAENFKKLVTKYNLEEQVIFTGKVPWEKVPLYYQIANIFATASRSETQGLTVIEALGASVPVICANDEAFLSAIVDGLNGLLFKNRKEYEKKLIEIFEDENLYEQLKNQTRISSLQHSSTYFADKILTVYKCALKSKKKKRKILVRVKDKVREVFFHE